MEAATPEMRPPVRRPETGDDEDPVGEGGGVEASLIEEDPLV
jgi:hypothetical protein